MAHFARAAFPHEFLAVGHQLGRHQVLQDRARPAQRRGPRVFGSQRHVPAERIGGVDVEAHRGGDRGRDGPRPALVQSRPAPDKHPPATVGQQHLQVGDVVVAARHTEVLLGWEWADDEVAVVEIGGWLVGEPTPGEQGHPSGGVGIDFARDVHGEHEHRPGVVRDAHRCGAQRRHEHGRVGGQPFPPQQRRLCVGLWRHGMRRGVVGGQGGVRLGASGLTGRNGIGCGGGHNGALQVGVVVRSGGTIRSRFQDEGNQLPAPSSTAAAIQRRGPASCGPNQRVQGASPSCCWDAGCLAAAGARVLRGRSGRAFGQSPLVPTVCGRSMCMNASYTRRCQHPGPYGNEVDRFVLTDVTRWCYVHRRQGFFDVPLDFMR